MGSALAGSRSDNGEQVVYPHAYVGLAVPLAGPLRSVQQAVCERYALAPRSEAHLTLAYFGPTPSATLAALADALRKDLPPEGIARIRIDGVGGAYQIAGETYLIRDDEPERLRPFRRVVWLAAKAAPEMHALRDRARRAADSLGLGASLLRPEFFPHLTLGSGDAVSTRPGDGMRWDVHAVPKRATISWKRAPESLAAAKLHLTDEAVQPESLHLLRTFPADG